MPPIVLIWLALLGAPNVRMAPGATGPTVTALQIELRAAHDYGGSLDGIYGPKTQQAVRLYESQSGLPQDGNAGAAVLARVVATVGAGAPILQAGAQGGAVRDLQGLLTADGVQCTVDGNFGPATQQAVQTLQGERGLHQDGVVGPQTWRALFSRSYTIQSGDTIDAIAARFGIPAKTLLTENGGSAAIFAGGTLTLAYAGPDNGPAPAATASPAQNPAASVPKSTPSPQSGSQATGGAGSVGFIAGTSLGKWGSAGTPDISVVAVAQDASALRALQQGGLPKGMVLAVPASLWTAADRTSVLLATSDTAQVEAAKPRFVLWTGRLDDQSFSLLRNLGATVLVAREETVAAAQGNLSGGDLLALSCAQQDVPKLSTLAGTLQQNGYQLVSPLP